jgi:hypothetical protein
MAAQEPTFKAIFGDQWGQLPPVMQKHYANKPFSRDVVTVRGKMNFIMANWARKIMPLFKWLNILVPYAAENVDTTVHFRSEPDNAIYQFDRWIELPGKTYHFLSKMEHTQGDEVVEQFASRICWRMRYVYDGEKVLLLHKGYAFKLLGRFIPLPMTWITGKGYAEEVPIDDNSFRMRMTITHWLLGVYYEYNGVFSVTDRQL